MVPESQKPDATIDPAAHTDNPAILRLIAGFKILDGVLLLALALGLLRFLNQNLAVLITHWLTLLRVDPNNHYIHGLLARVTGLSHSQLVEISAGSFVYTYLCLTEGMGLWLRKRWGEYLTVVATGLFIPLEIYELFEEATAGKLVLLCLNSLIVAYLIHNLREKTEKYKFS